MFIGQLSDRSGFSKVTIRYYEKIGLIPIEDSVRLANNYKSYSERALRRLSHIRELKSAGFTLVEIADMLESFQHAERPCVDLPARLADRVARLGEEIKTLERCRQSILKFLDACDCACVMDDGLPGCMRAR